MLARTSLRSISRLPAAGAVRPTAAAGSAIARRAYSTVKPDDATAPAAAAGATGDAVKKLTELEEQLKELKVRFYLLSRHLPFLLYQKKKTDTRASPPLPPVEPTPILASRLHQPTTPNHARKNLCQGIRDPVIRFRPSRHHRHPHYGTEIRSSADSRFRDVWALGEFVFGCQDDAGGSVEDVGKTRGGSV